MQQDLFPAEPAPPVVLTGLFAEVVLDRPIEQVYTYAVGPELESSIGVGKRVRVPFGRGDKAIVGYCVGIAHTAPERHPNALTDADGRFEFGTDGVGKYLLERTVEDDLRKQSGEDDRGGRLDGK